jgi:hypothetical protein
MASLLMSLINSKESESIISALNIMGAFFGFGLDLTKSKAHLIDKLSFFKRNSQLIPIKVWERIFSFQESWDMTIQIASILILQIALPNDYSKYISRKRKEKVKIAQNKSIFNGDQKYRSSHSLNKSIKNQEILDRGHAEAKITDPDAKLVQLLKDIGAKHKSPGAEGERSHNSANSIEQASDEVSFIESTWLEKNFTDNELKKILNLFKMNFVREENKWNQIKFKEKQFEVVFSEETYQETSTVPLRDTTQHEAQANGFLLTSMAGPATEENPKTGELIQILGAEQYLKEELYQKGKDLERSERPAKTNVPSFNHDISVPMPSEKSSPEERRKKLTPEKNKITLEERKRILSQIATQYYDGKDIVKIKDMIASKKKGSSNNSVEVKGRKSRLNMVDGRKEIQREEIQTLERRKDSGRKEVTGPQVMGSVSTSTKALEKASSTNIFLLKDSNYSAYMLKPNLGRAELRKPLNSMKGKNMSAGNLKLSGDKSLPNLSETLLGPHQPANYQQDGVLSNLKKKIFSKVSISKKSQLDVLSPKGTIGYLGNNKGLDLKGSLFGKPITLKHNKPSNPSS